MSLQPVVGSGRPLAAASGSTLVATVLLYGGMQRLAGEREHRLAEAFGQGRVRMDQAPRRPPAIASQAVISIASAIRSVTWGPIMCTAEHRAVARLGDDLHEPALAHDVRLADRAEVELLGHERAAASRVPAPPSRPTLAISGVQ